MNTALPEAKERTTRLAERPLTNSQSVGYPSWPMALEIPRRYIPAMIKIRQLSDTAADELLKALESSPIASDHEEMATSIAPSIPSIPIDDLKPILDALYSIYYVRESSDVAQRRFLNDLFDAIRKSENPELAVSEDEAPYVRKRLERLLSIENLNNLSKAITLQRDGERLYCGAKILSDLRPVFGRDVKSKPPAAVITHTLQIGYHEVGDHREFFVVLDQGDLDDLQRVVERAQSKATTLDALLRDWGMSRLGI